MTLLRRPAAFVFLLTATGYVAGCSGKTEHRLVGVWERQGDPNASSKPQIKDGEEVGLKPGQAVTVIPLTSEFILRINADGSYADEIRIGETVGITEGRWQILSEEGDQLTIKLTREMDTINGVVKESEQSSKNSLEMTIKFENQDSIQIHGTSVGGKPYRANYIRQSK